VNFTSDEMFGEIRYSFADQVVERGLRLESNRYALSDGFGDGVLSRRCQQRA